MRPFLPLLCVFLAAACASSTSAVPLPPVSALLWNELLLEVAAGTTPPSLAPARLWDALCTSGECASTPGNHSSLTPERRVPCGQWWEYEVLLGKESCEQRQCLWLPSNDSVAWCVYPEPATTPLKTLHVAQGCHFDAGFVKPIVDIVNLWFDEFFPLAARVGANLTASSATNLTLAFTAQSWLVDLFLNCPPQWPGLHCPSPSAVAAFNASVKAGYVTWHAFPFNGEPEFFDADTLLAAIDMTHRLDDAFGLPHKTLMSQRDVPGMTRSIIPLLRSRNITTVSVGVNGGSTPPNTPYLFKWADEGSNTSVNAVSASVCSVA